MMDRICRHRTEAQMLRCSVCAFGTVKPKPTRRRPTDSERLDYLFRHGLLKFIRGPVSWYLPNRRAMDRRIRLMREEAKHAR